MKTLVATALGLMLMLPVAESHAACERSKRIEDANAQCMTSEKWSTGGWFRRQHHAKAKNECPDWGKVVAKVDIQGGTDTTWDLRDGNWREGSWRSPKSVRAVTCCSDLSDLCSKSDVLTPQGCETQYDKSSAESTCQDESFQVRGESCVISAFCKIVAGYGFNTSITVHYPDTKTLSNCNGVLKAGSCPYEQPTLF